MGKAAVFAGQDVKILAARNLISKAGNIYPKWSSSGPFTQGGIPFPDSNGDYKQNANLFWDDTNSRLGLGTATPTERLTVFGNIAFGGSGNTLTSPLTEIIIQQTGDTFGTSSLRVQNRGGSAGALLTNTGLDLVDLGFKPNTGPQSILRLEHRSAGLFSSNNTNGELQWQDDSLVTSVTVFAIGKNSSVITSGNFGIGIANPSQKFDILGKFQVDTNGDLVKLKNVTYSWPSAHGTANSVLTTDASGNLSWTAPSSGGITTRTNRISSYVVNTNYQNTTGKPMFVSISILNNTANTGFAIIYSDSAVAPTTEVSRAFFPGTVNLTVRHNFWVLPGDYYTLSTGIAASLILQDWWEWY